MTVARLVRREGGETWINGYLQIDEVHTYEVQAPKNSNRSTILNWPGLPKAGSLALLGNTPLWVGRVAYSHPNPHESMFTVTVPYSNQTSQFERDVNGNPVDDPTKAVKRVSISYRDESVPVTDAKFRGCTRKKPEGKDGTPITKPSWIPDEGPVVNSAGEPIALTRIKRVKHVSVQKVFRDWSDDWEDFQNAVNTNKVTIEVRDSEGIRATHTFQPYTLRLTIDTPEEWKDAKLYFRVSFNMEHNEDTWIHSELDRGAKRRVYVGQYKPDGTTYSQGDLDNLEIDGAFGYASIMTDNDTVAIGEPVLFNGSGAEQPLPREVAGSYTEGEGIYLNFDVETNLRSFSPLNL